MRCNVCGNELDDSMDFCPKCGTRKPVFAKRVQEAASAEAAKDEGKPGTAASQQRRTAAQRTESASIDSIVVKNRKTSAIAGVDAKKITIYVVGFIVLAIFIVITLIDHVFKKKVDVGAYTLSVPASMKQINDEFYQIYKPDRSIALSNNRLILYCEEYDIYSIYPGAMNAPDPSEFEAYASYLVERDKANEADLQLLKDLDAMMPVDLKGYNKDHLTLNELEFTYEDQNFGKNYVQMMTKKKDNKVYLFTILCSGDKSESMQKDIRKIFSSIKEN